MCSSGVEVVFGYGAQGVLFAGGYSLQWISEASTAPQLDLHEDERLGSLVQNTMTSEIRFRALLAQGRTESCNLHGFRLNLVVVLVDCASACPCCRFSS